MQVIRFYNVGLIFKTALFYFDEFYRKRLYRIDDCRLHYAKLSPSMLLDEGTLLFSEIATPLPHMLVLGRQYALLETLVKTAVFNPFFADQERRDFVRRVIDIKEEIINRAPLGVRDQLIEKILDMCSMHEAYSPYPRAADVIAKSSRNFQGSFKRPPSNYHPAGISIQ